MKWKNTEDIFISSIDPLMADGLMKKIPRLNQERNVNGLIEILKSFTQKAKIESRDYYETAAIIRDIGIVMGSLKRHGINAISEVKHLDNVLIKAGNQNDLPPRDTLMHYTIWNPKGHRLRTYTAHQQEPFLIESIRISLPKIKDATRTLFELMNIDLSDLKAIALAFEIDRALRDFLDGLNYARKNVEPEVFIKNFRPYFEPIDINNETVKGPGAVTMPLHIFDFLLWGSTEVNDKYQAFTKNYVPYNLSEFRYYYLKGVNRLSFLDKIELKVKELKKEKEIKNVYPVLFAVNNWFKRIEGFRKSHSKYAVQAYQGKENHNFKTGSGGHTISDLGIVAMLTSKHSSRIKTLIN